MFERQRGMASAPGSERTGRELEQLLSVKLASSQTVTSNAWERECALQRLQVPKKLLPKSCSLTTNWVAITGTSCAGKTTLINHVSSMGFAVEEEGARKYVEGVLAEGNTIEDIRERDYEFRNQVFLLNRERELHRLSQAYELTFLDRTVIDSISAHRASGYDPHDILNRLEPYRYRAVFICTLLPFVDDGFRTRNEARRHFLDAALERDYRALGYEPIRIPYLSVAERADFMLEHL
ncbi:MAG: ATP-binding protein [Bdellovibrionales bacterium]|nr:ATP-binding protein [Bdellovibrionales bacterium]